MIADASRTLPDERRHCDSGSPLTSVAAPLVGGFGTLVGVPQVAPPCSVTCLVMKSRTAWLAASVGVGLLITAGWLVRPAGSAAVPQRSPLADSAAVDAMVLHGDIAERLVAGSYVYLRIHRADAESDAWVATFIKDAPAAGAVTATVYARSPSFVSPRLARTFAPLLFATVVSTSHP